MEITVCGSMRAWPRSSPYDHRSQDSKTDGRHPPVLFKLSFSFCPSDASIISHVWAYLLLSLIQDIFFLSSTHVVTPSFISTNLRLTTFIKKYFLVLSLDFGKLVLFHG